MSELQFIKSGSTLLDCALGGGFALGRLVTISGWQSTGKTGACIEASANFAKSYSKGNILYVDAESAFDVSYAEKLGFPVDRVQFEEATTVEDFSSVLDAFLENQDSNTPGLVTLDSLDSLCSAKEKATALADIGGFGAEKAKLIGLMLRKVVSVLEEKNTTLIIIQQLRDSLGGYGGATKSGGKAIGFYASQEIELKKLKTLERTIDKVSKPYGVEMLFKVKKNKVGKPFREGKFNLLFDYGIDDLTSNLDFLTEVGRLSELEDRFIKTNKGELLKKTSAIVDRIEECNDAKAIRDNIKSVAEAATKVWNEIEAKHDIARVSKYE